MAALLEGTEVLGLAPWQAGTLQADGPLLPGVAPAPSAEEPVVFPSAMESSSSSSSGPRDDAKRKREEDEEDRKIEQKAQSGMDDEERELYKLLNPESWSNRGAATCWIQQHGCLKTLGVQTSWDNFRYSYS